MKQSKITSLFLKWEILKEKTFIYTEDFNLLKTKIILIKQIYSYINLGYDCNSFINM